VCGKLISRRTLFLGKLAPVFVALSSLWASETATVTRVVDCDTIAVAIAGRQERVRLIGADTPERVRPKRRSGTP
jgi:endonuclease YncB( thermonuclease family)